MTKDQRAHDECFKKRVKGVKWFNCLVCGEFSANYANGIDICLPCCERLSNCVICGKELKKE